MKPFAAQIFQDNAAVFINPHDFADLHDLNGTKCLAICQEVTVTEKMSEDEHVSSYGSYYEIFGSHLMVNVKTLDLKGEENTPLPVYGQVFTVDGKPYLVESVAEDLGVTTLILVANDR